MALASNITDVRITGPLLLASMFFPSQLKPFISKRLRSKIASPLFRKVLILLATLDLLQKLNRSLSQGASNNWRKVEFRPSQELVLITGGSSGLGLLMAKEFVKRGVKVIITDINPPRESLPANIHFYQSDVTSITAVSQTAVEIRKDHGDPTVLINNAGIGTFEPILECQEKSVRSTFDVNTISHFWTTREFAPAMVKNNHGHIVTIASLASYFVHATNVEYCCSKASALAFHEGIASELLHVYDAPNVRTTVVTPSWIRTPLIERPIKKSAWSAEVMEPDFVIQKIVNQVISGKGGHIVLPKKLNFITMIRGLPLWLQLYARNAKGKELKIVKDALDLEG